MKKINSINYGYKILSGALICFFVIPAISNVIWLITKQELIYSFAKLSLIVGAMIFLFLLLLLKVEFHQDKKMNDYFLANTKTRIPIKNGLYECQNCGNTHVKFEHKICNICGTNFKNRGEEDGRR